MTKNQETYRVLNNRNELLKEGNSKDVVNFISENINSIETRISIVPMHDGLNEKLFNKFLAKLSDSDLVKAKAIIDERVE